MDPSTLPPAPTAEEAERELAELQSSRQIITMNLESLRRQLEENAARTMFVSGVVAAGRRDHPSMGTDLRVIEGEGAAADDKDA